MTTIASGEVLTLAHPGPYDQKQNLLVRSHDGAEHARTFFDADGFLWLRIADELDPILATEEHYTDVLLGRIEADETEGLTFDRTSEPEWFRQARIDQAA